MLLRKIIGALLAFVVLTSLSAPAQMATAMPLDGGFHRLYDLDFAGAQREFARFEQAQPGNPLGPVAEAAAYVFSELNRLGVLEARFFTDDDTFRSRTKLQPDPTIRRQFNDALARAQAVVARRLAAHGNDRDALFAKTLAAGLQADYTSLIEDRNMAALRLTREATASAQRLLAICPDCYDAYVATGISEYLIGTLSPPLRWLVRLGGYSGDKAQGMEHLRVAADRGRYLAPFARILLAVAYVREKKPEDARRILAQLETEFPDNPLFRRELARLEKH